MRSRNRKLGQQLEARLTAFERSNGLLPGVEDSAARETFIEQVVESVRRIDFVLAIRGRGISELRRMPASDLYDPLRAALLFARDGNLDEAAWQVFLSVHFGKSQTAWRYPRDIYGRLGQGGLWGWQEVSADVAGFREWLDANQATLKGGDGVKRRFGNHRKYTSLSASSSTGTGAAVESYVAWVGASGDHQSLFADALRDANYDPKVAFGLLYQSMHAVQSFGRIGRFDYLTMLGKLGLAQIEPDLPYMQGATGPLIGAKLMFGELANTKAYDTATLKLGNALGVGMQVMEDSLCNWQKSPEKFIAFRG